MGDDFCFLFQKSFRRMNRLILLLLGLLLVLNGSNGIKKKYLDSDMDGINDADDDDDDNDGIDDEDEDLDGDGIANKDDNDDDGDGTPDQYDKDDDGDGEDDDDDQPRAATTKAKSINGSGPWGTLVFGYFFGLTQYVLKTA